MDRIETWTIIRVAFCGLCKAASQVALVVKKPPATAGDTRDMGLIPVSGRFPGERNGNPLQYSCLENPDGGASRTIVHGVAESGMTEQVTLSLVSVKF